MTALVGTPTGLPATSGGTNTQNFTVPLPPGTAAGDLLVLITGGYATANFTMPAGWTQRQQATWTGGTDHRSAIFTNLLTAPAGASVLLSNSAWASASQVVWALRGLANTLLPTTVAWVTGSGNNTLTPPAHTPGAGTSTLWAFGGRGGTASLRTISMPNPAGLVAGSASWRQDDNNCWNAGYWLDTTTTGPAPTVTPADTGGYNYRAAMSIVTAGPPAPAPSIRAWDGTQWVEGPLRGWDGAAWRPVRAWNGTQWQPVG